MILLWHGYLLGGTGSNVYTRALAREWTRAGHDVVLVARLQPRHRDDVAEQRPLIPGEPPRQRRQHPAGLGVENRFDHPAPGR